MANDVLRLRQMLEDSRSTVFFGGAGVSTESGIPDFRSSQGVYAAIREYGERPEDLLSLSFFRAQPEKFFRFYKEKMLYPDVKPNAAHRVLAGMERAGRLDAVITQNIDGLHQAAGSKRVLELHGSVHRNHCLGCGRSYTLGEVMSSSSIVPRCGACGGIVKPDVVLYGEQLDQEVLEESAEVLRKAEAVVVGGTSLVVYPAAGLLRYAKGKIVLINLSETPMDGEADLVLHEKVGSLLGQAFPEWA